VDFGALRKRETWQAFAPGLHIADASFCQSIKPLGVPPQAVRGAMDQLKLEGYLQTSQVDWGVDLPVMADTVRRLSAENLSPVFAFLYDEFWAPFFKLHGLYAELLGGKYQFLPDFWVWNVDPKRGDAGWTPHRDKGHKALFPDGSPKSLTTWIPLSSATPLNGCMYILPALHDPNYGTPRDDQMQLELPSVRALPAEPGDFLIWNQAVLHWGSKTSPRAPESRVSMAFELQRADIPPFNGPLIEPLLVLPFEARLKLIAKQILQYRHMYKLEPRVEQFALQLLA
jgi:hypothetical protein